MQQIDAETLKKLKQLQENCSSKIKHIYADYLDNLKDSIDKCSNDIMMSIIMLPVFEVLYMLILSGSNGSDLTFDDVMFKTIEALKKYLFVYRPQSQETSKDKQKH